MESKINASLESSSDSRHPLEKIRQGQVRAKRDNLYTLFVKAAEPHIPKLPEISTPEILKPLDAIFQCTERGSSVGNEIFTGVINFFACMYVLPVLPLFMSRAGYEEDSVFAILALMHGLANIISGLVTNTPMIISAPTAETIFLVSALQNDQMSPSYGNLAVVANGAAIAILGLAPPLARLIVKFIPGSIQIGTTVGIGLLTALAGASDVELVQKGVYKVLKNGPITAEILICLSGFFLVAASMVMKSRVSYIIALGWGTFIWWTSERIWPDIWVAVPAFKTEVLPDTTDESSVLAFSLMFLTVLTVFGLAKALSDLANLTNVDGSVPHMQYLMLIIGGVNIASGLFYGPAFSLSVEASSGIKGGARTGLSSIVCGSLFLGTLFFGPLFLSIPVAATSPVLISVGMMLFMNVQRIDFTDLKYAFPAFCTLFFIPFTSSTLVGLVIGYCCYIFLSVFTLDIIDNTSDILAEYFPNTFGVKTESIVVNFESGPVAVPVPVAHVETSNINAPVF